MFHSTKIPVWNFGDSTCPMELYNYVHSSCTDPIQATACLLTVLVNKIQKSGSGDNNFVKWKWDISVQLTKMTRPVKVDQCKQKWSIPFDVPTEMYGILGWMESTLRFPFDLFNTSWTPPWSPCAKKAGWVCPFQEVRLITGTPTRPENNSTSFKARLSAKSPGANGLKQFTWFAHSDYFSGHHYEFFRKRGGGRKVTVFFNTFRKFSITLILLMIHVLSSHNY